MTEEIIERGLCSRKTGAVCSRYAIQDTVKIADEDGNVSETPDRKAVYGRFRLRRYFLISADMAHIPAF